jgi:hypothetical protein
VNRHYLAVADRANHRCEYCRAPENISNFLFEIDHIAPSSGGGGNELENLALACRSCNAYKSDQRGEHDGAAADEVALFNPRADRWDEHFAWDLDRGEMLGLSPTGRVTIERLQLNSPAQVLARLLWIAYRIFP